MPALPVVPQVLKFRINWGVDGDTLAETIHYFHYTGGPPSPANCATMAATAVSAGDSQFAAYCATTTGMNNCEVTDLTSATSSQGVGGSPWVGTEGSERLSPGTAVLVNHLISRRYRGGKPRSYLPLGTASDVDTTGLWKSASAGNFETQWGAWVAAIKAGGAGCVIDNIVNVSYYHGFTVVTSPTTGRSRNVPTLRAAPLVDVINGHTVPLQIASQRRRNRDA